MLMGRVKTLSPGIQICIWTRISIHVLNIISCYSMILMIPGITCDNLLHILIYSNLAVAQLIQSRSITPPKNYYKQGNSADTSTYQWKSKNTQFCIKMAYYIIKIYEFSGTNNFFIIPSIFTVIFYHFVNKNSNYRKFTFFHVIFVLTSGNTVSEDLTLFCHQYYHMMLPFHDIAFCEPQTFYIPSPADTRVLMSKCTSGTKNSEFINFQKEELTARW
jgi:hypothetical protein